MHIAHKMSHHAQTKHSTQATQTNENTFRGRIKLTIATKSGRMLWSGFHRAERLVNFGGEYCFHP
jgi:hypothetical protein